jgi:hypothetical protein
MPCSYYYNADCDCVVVKIEGCATLADILTMLYHIIKDENYHADCCALVDWRQFAGGLNPVSARVMYNLLTQMSARPLKESRRAWLVRSENRLTDAMSTLQRLFAGTGVKFRTFTDVHLALEWVGLKELPPPTSLVWTTIGEWKETERASLPGALSFVRQENATVCRFIITADKHQAVLAAHAGGPSSELAQLWYHSDSVGDQVASLLEVVRRVEYFASRPDE